MPTISVADARAQIAARTPAPVYVLTGPDDREKSDLAAECADLVEEELRAFNVERFYGSDDSGAAVAESANTLPMMGDRRVIVVLQADKLLVPRRRGAAEGEEDEGGGVEALVDYLGRPEPKTTLVFVLPPAEPGTKTHPLSPLPGNTRIVKALLKVATIVPCGEFASGTEAVRWMTTRAAEGGLRFEPAAAKRLVELAASDPAKLRTDVDRVITYAAGEGTITLAHVDEAIVEHETSTDVWALVRALEAGNAPLALKELRARIDAGDTGYGILGQIAWAIRNPRGRYPAQRLPAAIDALFRTDLALKSSGGDPRVLIERLIVELCG